MTSIFFVSSKNLERTLENIIQIMGDRNMSVCKEISKFNENTFRGSSIQIYQDIKEKKINLKGEFTLVLSGIENISKTKINDTTIKEMTKLIRKYSLTETVKIVHNLTGISKKDIYQKALELKYD